MIDTSKVGPYQFVTEGMAFVTMDGEDKKKKPRPGKSYRAARRNAVKTARRVWRSSAEIKYRPTEPRGCPRTYKPNGAREVARRKARTAA